MHVFALAWVAGVVFGYPSYFECNDPRFEPGNEAMNVDINDNQHDPRMSFKAEGPSALFGRFKHGDEIKLFIKSELDDTYTKDDGAGGVFFAIRARTVLGYASDYGEFMQMSDDLAHSIDGNPGSDGPPCANQIVSAENFKGSSFAIWKAGEKTYGDVELTLLWGNGPSSDDPSSSKYLHRRVIKLKGPKMPDTPPYRRLEAAEMCVATGRSNYNMPHSPVFVQNLRTFPEKSVTFPSSQCLACREDQKKRCSSAMVECPSRPGALAVERLFSSADCSGEATLVTKLTTRYTHCPSEEYHSPYRLDLERFVKKVLRDYPAHFQDEVTVRAAIAEYRRMLHLIQKFPDAPVVPSKRVDIVWHEHILDTQQYKQDSQRMFGRYIHHKPSFGDNEDEAVKTEKEGMLEDQAEMFKRYVQLFEDEPPTNVWPTARRLGGAGHLPDCCKATCVKVDCVSCVGCNAIDCGKFEESLLESPKQHVLPEEFAGYVPIPRSIADNMLVVDQDYLCQVTPLNGMTLKWTISGDAIYLEQSLDTAVAEAWHSVGFTDVEPFNMGMGDFMVSFFTGNYSGVRDFYKFDSGNNYPCFDVLGQCSGDGASEGTNDILDVNWNRQNGLSISSWSRKLHTADTKDSEIKAESKKVLFAYGKDDWFTYHGKQQQASCNINFFTMETDCAGSKPAEERWVCSVCDHEYIANDDGAGSGFEDLPDDWKCPVCDQPKSVYNKVAPSVFV